MPSQVVPIVINFTAHSVYLKWTAPDFNGNTDILGYNVYQRAVSSQNILQLVQTTIPSSYTTTATMFNITSGVMPYTKYELAVEACNMIGCGSRMVSAPVRTSPARE